MDERIQKALDRLVEETFKSGLLQGQGGMGTSGHRKAMEESKAAYTELMRLLELNLANLPVIKAKDE